MHHVWVRGSLRETRPKWIVIIYEVRRRVARFTRIPTDLVTYLYINSTNTHELSTLRCERSGSGESEHRPNPANAYIYLLIQQSFVTRQSNPRMPSISRLIIREYTPKHIAQTYRPKNTLLHSHIRNFWWHSRPSTCYVYIYMCISVWLMYVLASGYYSAQIRLVLLMLLLLWFAICSSAT